MGMREKIAWRHVVNQKGNLYLMDEAEKTYVVDFSKLKERAGKILTAVHLFHMIGIYALPISLMILTSGMDPDFFTKILLVVSSIGLVFLIDYLVMVMLVIPKNIVEILEEKKQK